jgi:type VI secretion system protein ImpJ
MSTEPRILWTEGLFLCPQTFQQHDDFMLENIEARSRPIEPHYWGVVEFSIQESKLDTGVFSIKKCRGIFPDGTIFDTTGTILEVNVSNADLHKKIYLAIGAKQESVQETVIDSQRMEKRTTRYIVTDEDVTDTQTIGAPTKTERLQVGRLNFQLILADKPQNNYTQIALAYISECDKNGILKLSTTFIPPTLYSHASFVIKNYIEDILAQLQSRGDILSTRLANPNTGEVNDIIDLQMLQIMNRYLPLFEYLSIEQRIHPKQIYTIALQLVGELATFATKKRRPLSYPEYIHDDLQLTFRKLFNDIHEYLQYSTIPKALAIPLKQSAKHETVYTSAHLLQTVFTDHTRFVLAARGDIPLGELQHRIPKVVTMASNLDHLGEQVRTHTPGVPFRAQPSVPREIPYHQNSVYFDLDITSPHWERVVSNRQVNVHVDSTIPNLKLEIWAIRGKKIRE